MCSGENPPAGALPAHDDLESASVWLMRSWPGNGSPTNASSRMEDTGISSRHNSMVRRRCRPAGAARIETPDKGAHQVVARDDAVGVGPRLGAPPGHLPDPAEEPERRIVPVLSEREEELPVESIRLRTPGVPALPFRGSSWSGRRWGSPGR